MKLNKSITLRVIFGLLTSISFVSCLGEGTDQLHGMVRVNFPSTAVCQAQQREVQFRNVSGEDIMIRGAIISGGTDPDGNFNLTGVRVGSEMIPSEFGKLDRITIPPDTIYSFVLSYTPRSPNADHDAILDIVYEKPQPGVIQVALSGISTNRAPNCSTGGGGGGGGGGGNGVGDLDGNLTITINRIALVSSALQLPISTDPDKTRTPFQEPILPILFDADANSVTLPLIPEGASFILPPTTTPPLSTSIPNPTLVTSEADASGTYGDNGSIVVENVPIHLKERFEADFVVTLTTESVNVPPLLSKPTLRQAGFTLSDDQNQVFGSRVSSDDNSATLIGIATFSNASGTGTVATTIGGTLGAVIIEATINSSGQ